MPLRTFAIIVTAVIVAAIVSGFFIVGSPQEERLRRFDDQRVNDLQILQNEIINYWIQKDRLPASLDELRNDITGFIPPTDPDTIRPYEYRSTTSLSFELCAAFARPSDDIALGFKAPQPVRPYFEPNQNWSHGEGRTCFERTIDPELYQKSGQVPIPAR